MSSNALVTGPAASSPLTPSDMAPSSLVAGKATPLRAFGRAFEAFFSLQRESAAMRFVARGILTAWLLPIFFALFATLNAPVAQAQGAPAQTVIVLDFATSGGLDPLLGRKAADGLAVELQRSGSYDVVPRQRVEEAVAQQAGLQPPYNDIAQIKLAETVNASSVFSGRIASVNVTPGRSARVTIEARQLDVITGDYINGTVVSESTEQKLGQVANEILIDEAINKAVFAAVRSMRQTTLPTGTVLNTATDFVVLNVGANAGARPGQRFSVLRDKYDPARNVTERRKIGEVTIARVNADQSEARISAGGREGVQTNDHVRQIFEPGNYPRTSLGPNGNSVTPVTAPVDPVRRGGGLGGLVQKSSKGILGLVGLAALVSLVGFGGGSGTNPPRAVDITEANPTQTYPQPRFTFQAGFDGINFSQTLDRESVVAYIIYRGTARNFTPDVTNIQSVVDARFDASNKNITFTDAGIVGEIARRQVTITSTTTGTGATTGTATAGTSSIDFASTGITPPDTNDTFTSTNNQIVIKFTQRPLLIGQTYYYRVGRITAQRSRTNTTGNTNTTNNTTTVTLLPVRSPISDSTGGYTPLFLPRIVPNDPSVPYNTDNFSLRVDTDAVAFNNNVFSFDPVTGNIITTGSFAANFGYLVPTNANVVSGADQFRFEVSTSPAFPRNATFVSPDIPAPPNTGRFNEVVLDLGNQSNIRIPSSPQNPYVPGVTTLYARVLSRNSQDANPTFRISPTLTIQNAAGQDRTATSSRFLTAPDGGSGGINVGRGGGIGARTAGGASTNPRVLAPR